MPVHVRTDLPVVCGFAWPPKSPEDLRRSVDLHAGYHRRGIVPSGDILKRTLKLLLDCYPRPGPPLFTTSCLCQEIADRGWLHGWKSAAFFNARGVRFLGGDKSGKRIGELCPSCVRRGVREAISLLNPSSTPGVPFCSIAARDSEFQENKEKGSILEESVMARFKDIFALGSKIFSMSPMELIENNVCSPIRVFIKDEPTKIAKIALGKLRLISALSVDDQVIDRMLYSRQNDCEIDQWRDIISQPGLGLDDEGLRTLASSFREMLKTSDLQSTDISNWDYSVQSWELDLDCEFRIEAASGNPIFGFLARVRTHCIKNKVFCFPDGSLVPQGIDGTQASGWYNTSSSNSRMRAAVRIVALLIAVQRKLIAEPSSEVLVNIKTMGDDCVEGVLDDCVLSIINELGHDIKEITTYSELAGIEFCSHKWLDNGLAYPINVGKILFRFFNHSNRDSHLSEWVAQLSDDLRNHPDFKRITDVVRAWVEQA
nr:MAG: putative RNA-dependent RNA polymerase [Barnaviridae sp.]